jgi:hypothetical protein
MKVLSSECCDFGLLTYLRDIAVVLVSTKRDGAQKSKGIRGETYDIYWFRDNTVEPGYKGNG